MEKKNVSRKQELAEQLGMTFEEASELFRVERLEIMKMENVLGGSDADAVFFCFNA